ncbi:MAG: AAA family ATPase [Ardenticatenaceae bacterium]|nr:AAA family ATPase [Ardenticatenaceae bacterium]MCB8974511.1 AAA family ATPase [Ardenticatenaceae bacterium]
MSEQEQLQQAIVSLDEKRPLLGDAVVDTTIAALQERLTELDSAFQNHHNARTAQRKQVSILFATITGIAEVADTLPNTNMLDVMNGLWRRLDSAITNQDGTIDKHMGEGVMGLFGVPVVHEDDAERAIRAALQMRAALSDLIAEQSNQQAAISDAEIAHLRGLQVRIGINTGPVMLGRVGSSEEYTVIGDAVNVASRLEKSAPPGGIIIAHETYMLVHDRFNVEPLGLVTIRGRSEPIQVYLVLGIKPRLFYASGRGVEGVETRMVGRDAELSQLKGMLQQATEKRVGQLLTITGDAGVGKSRLVHEFNNWVRTLPYEVPVFKGRTYQQISQLPYGLIRDMLATYFGIQDSDPPAVAEEKLVQGMGQFMGQVNDEIRTKANVIGQLIGLDLSVKVQSLGQTGEAPQLRQAAFEYLAALFEIIAQNNSAVLLFLEDLHWADEASLDLIRFLAESCQRVPLLIIGVTRPFDSQSALRRERPLPGTQVHLDSLSPEESQQLVIEILKKLPEIPPDLSELLLQRAEGNPFYVEELIKVLIEDGVIIAGEEKWQLRRNQLTEVRVPPNITSVLQGRLDRLTHMERVTLQRAAVVGRVFWDTAVFQMNATAEDPLDQNQTRTALQALEKRELIFQRQSSGFAGTKAYLFKHAILHQVTYESVLLRARPIYHKQVADWLAKQSGERIAEYASTIAEHYEMAEEKSTAAELYEMAAQRAQDAFNMEMATLYYCRSLSLLTEMSHYALWQLRLQEDLGQLLLRQARLVEAAQTFMTMRFTAEEDGDLLLQARAWNGLAEVQKYQADYVSMLDSAMQAERVAWLVNAESAWVQALLHKGTALLHQGDVEMALLATSRALETSQRLNEPELLTRCLQQACEEHIKIGRYRPVEQYLAQLKGQSALLERLGNLSALAAANRAIGEVNNRLGRFDRAVHWFLSAVKLYRELEDQVAIAQTLNLLGETSRLRGRANQAVPFYRKALMITNGLDCQLEIMKVRTNLAAALVDLGSCEAAERAVRPVTRYLEDFGKMAGWYESSRVYVYQALAYLGRGQLDEALRFANRAHRKAAVQESDSALGFAWYGLALVLARGRDEIRPLQIDNSTYDASDCFAESLRLFSTVNGGGVASARDQARTLWAWAAHEAAIGNQSQSDRLSQRARELAEAQGIQLTDW